MNIDWAIPCRYVEVHDNLGTLIGAGIDTFWVQQMPVVIQLHFALRLVGTKDEFGEDEKHTVRNSVRDPKDQVVGQAAGELVVGMPDARPDWLNGVTMSMAIAFQAGQAGTYTVEFGVDESSVAAVPLHVVQGLPPGVELPPGP